MAGQLNIKLNSYTHPVLEYLRVEARKERWSGTEGLRQFCREKFKARLNANEYQEINSITFSSQEAYDNFMSDPDVMWYFLKQKNNA